MAGDERIVPVHGQLSIGIIFGGFQLRELAVRVGTDGGEGFINSGACPSGDISGDIVEVGVGTVYRIGGDTGGRGGGVTSLRQQDLGAGVVVGKGNFIIISTTILSDNTTGLFRRGVSESFHAFGI